MKRFFRAWLLLGPVAIVGGGGIAPGLLQVALAQQSHATQTAVLQSSKAAPITAPAPSSEYQQLQKRLAQGWNTWDVHSVATQVLLPEGLAIHLALEHNSTEWHGGFLSDILIGRQGPNVEQVFPGPHAWDGSYTELRLSWQGHNLRIQSAHDGKDLV